jgi:hypothetical protein
MTNDIQINGERIEDLGERMDERYIYVSLYTFMSIYLYVCVCMHICMYIHMDIHT